MPNRVVEGDEPDEREAVVGGIDMYPVVLLVGAAIVIADGQLIIRQGPSYLAETYGDPRRARQVAGLVALLFHLVMLGVVLLGTAGLDPHPTVPAVLHLLGLLLISTALAHVVTMAILSRLRRQQSDTDLANAHMDAPPPAAPDARAGTPGGSATPAEPAPPTVGAPSRGRVTRLGRSAKPR
jgi:hypothetical protein